MAPEAWAALAVVTAALISGLVALITLARRLPIEQQAAEVDAAADLTGAASGLVDRLAARLDKLQCEVDALERINREQVCDLARLRADLSEQQIRIHKLEQENVILKQKNEALNRRVRQLSHLLREAGLNVPPASEGLSGLDEALHVPPG